jgi:DNA-binding XRE family transcriptional regulator
MNLKRAWLKPESLERISRNPRLAGRRQTMGGKPTIRSTRTLQEMREALGLTQAQLAEATGVRRTMIANLENGRYAAIIWVGIKMYLFFASVAAKKQLTPLYLEAKRDVARFIDYQRELNAQVLRKSEREVETKRKKVEALEKQLAAEEAQLRSV